MLKSLKYCLCFVVLLVVLLPKSGHAQYNEADLAKQANSMFISGDYAGALPFFSQLLSLHPTSAEYNYKYGACSLYGDAQKKADAVKYLRFASGHSDVPPEVWFYLGRAYHLNYRFAEAINAFKKFQEKADNRILDKYQVQRHLEACNNGLKLLSDIKEVVVLDKTNAAEKDFFRLYDLKDIGGRILVTPEELLSNEDKKRKHKSLIHFPGNRTTIYFSSYGKDGSTGLDIYSADILPGGKYSSPRKLSGEVNTNYDEDYPFLHPDGKTLYFSSTGHNSMGGYDVFKSQMDPTSGAFETPENLDFAVNTPDDDLFYIADSLNHLANFSSTRASKQGRLDVYKVEVSSQPLNIAMVKGTFINQIHSGSAGAKIVVLDAATNEVVDSTYTDAQTGDYVLSLPQGGKYKLQIEANDGKVSHTSIMDVPHSQGVKAYLQETNLALSAGVPQISVANHFDRYYEGDVTLLASQILKNRANLDVTTRQTALVSNSPATPEENLQQAYLQAGFSAGLSNEKILADARQRNQKLSKQRDELKTTAAKSFALAQSLFQQADSAANQISAMKTEVEASAPGDDRNILLLKIGVMQYKAANALRKAGNALLLAEFINTLGVAQDSLYNLSAAQTSELEESLSGNNFSEAVAELKAEKNLRENLFFNSQPDAVQKLRLQAGQQQEKANNLLNRAQALRQQQNNLEQKLTTNQKQLLSATAKEAAALEIENTALTEDIQASKRRTDKAFEQALAMQEEAFAKQQQYEFLMAVNKGEARGIENYASIPVLSPGMFTQLTAKLKQTSKTMDSVEIDPVIIHQLAGEYSEVLATLSEEDQQSFVKKYQASAARESEQTGKTDIASVEENTVIADTFGVENSQQHFDTAELQNPPETTSASREGQSNTFLAGPEVASNAPDSIKNDATAEEVSANLVEGEKFTSEEQDYSNTTIAENLPGNTANTANAANVEDTLRRITDSEEFIAQKPDNNETSTTSEAATINPAPFTDNSDLTPDLAKNTSDSEPGVIAEKISRDKVSLNAAQDSSPEPQQESEISNENNSIPQKEDAFDATKVSDPAAQIEIEQETIAAAEDWIEIIDESITELQKAPDGQSSDTSIQLVQYQDLRQNKLQEIETANKRILKLREVINGSAPQAERETLAAKNSDVPEAAPGTAQNLDNFPEPSVKEGNVADAQAALILKTAPNYYADLQKINTGENSKEAQLQQRIALNETLLKGLNSAVDGVADTDSATAAAITDTIKAEIAADRSKLQDEQNQLISETGKAEDYENGNISATEVSKETPQLAQLIAKIDDAAKTYEIKTDSLNGLSPGKAVIAQQIDVRQEYVAKLEENQQQIMSLNFTDRAEESNAAAAHLTELTAEISLVKNEIKTFESQLSSASNVEEGLSADGESEQPATTVTNEDLSTPEAPAASVTEKDSVVNEALNHWQERIDLIDAELVAGFGTVEGMDLTHSSELEQKALLNQRAAAAIDTEIRKMVDVLDMSMASAEKQDQIQMAIQKMQSMRADKLQEYDRLTAEADQEKLIADNAGVVEDIEVLDSGETKEIKEDPAALLDPLELKEEQQELSVNVLPEPGSFKFLSANVNFELARENIAELERVKIQMRQKLNAVASLENREERMNAAREYRELESKLERLESEVITIVTASNNTEIGLYQQAIADLRTQTTSAVSGTEVSASSINSDSIDAMVTEALAAAALLRERVAYAASDEEKLTKLKEAISLERKVIDLYAAEYSHLDKMHNAELAANSENSPSEVSPKTDSEAQAIPDTSATVGETDKTKGVANPAQKKPSDKEVIAQMQSITNVYAPSPAQAEIISASPELIGYLDLHHKNEQLERSITDGISLHQKLENSTAEQLKEVERLKKIVETTTEKDEKELITKRISRLEAEAAAGQKQALVTNQIVQELSAELKLKQRKAQQIREKLTPEQNGVAQSLLIRANSLDYEKMPPEGLAVQTSNDPATTRPEETIISPETGVNSTAMENPEATSGAELNAVTSKSEVAIAAEIKDGRFDPTLNFTGSVFFTNPEPLYSSASPIPINEGMPPGLVFQVQVGAFRNPIPQDLFAGLTPVMGEKLANGITRYRVGLFREFDKATQARQLVREMGYSDAFVVVYFNGERLSAADARRMIAEAEQMLADTRKTGEPATENSRTLTKSTQPSGTTPENKYTPARNLEPIKPISTVPAEITEKAEITSVPVETAEAAAAMMAQFAERTTYYQDSTAAGAAQVEVTPGLFFTVQVGVYSKPVPLSKLYGLNDLNTELTANGTIRYTTGRFASVQDAQNQKMAAIAAGVEDAFITAYYNGKRIGLAEAANLLQEHGQTVLWQNVSSVSVPQYFIYIGPFVTDVPQDVANTILALSRFEFKKIIEPGSDTTYYKSKGFSKEKEAQNLLQKLQKNGVQTVFLKKEQ